MEQSLKVVQKEKESMTELSLIRKIEYRKAVSELESQLKSMPDSHTGEELMKSNPVTHSFGDGLYVREIFMPAGEVIMSKIHKERYPLFMMSGSASILTENGIKEYKAPCYMMTEPGTQRVLYIHEDCICVTVHATEDTDLDKIEDKVIAKDFDDPAISLGKHKKIN